MAALITSWLTPASLFLLLNIVIGTIFLISRLFPPRTPQHQQIGHDGYNSAPPLQRSPSRLDSVRSTSFSTYKHPLPNQDIDHHLQPDNLATHPLERGPSILERVKSINFPLHKFSPQNPDTDYIEPTEHDTGNQQPLSRSLSILERVKSIDFTSFYRSDSVKSNQQTESPTTEEADSDTDMSNPVRGQVRRSKSEYSKVIQWKPSLEKMKKAASEISRHKAEEKEDEEEVERRRPTTTTIEKAVWSGDDDPGVDAKANAFIEKFNLQLKLQRWNSFLRYRDMPKGK